MSESDEAWRQYLKARQDMMGGAGVKAAIPRLEEAYARLARQNDGRALNVLGDLTQALTVAGRLDEATQRARLLATIGKAIRAPQFESVGLVLLGRIAFQLGRNDEALQAYEHAEQLYRDVRNDLGRANAVCSRGDVLFRLGRNDEALRAYTLAETLTKEIGDNLGRANAVLRQGQVLFRLGRNDEAMRAYEQAEQLSRDSGDGLGRANASLCRGDVLFRLGRTDEAMRAYEQAEQLHGKLGSDLGRANAVRSRGDVLFRLSRYDDASQAYEQAVSLASKAGDHQGCANSALRQGQALFQLARNEEALRAYEQAEQLSRDVGDVGGRANAMQRRGEVLFRIAIERKKREAFVQAESLLEAALGLQRDHGSTQNVVVGHSIHADALLGSGQYDRAVEVASTALAEVDSLRTRDPALLTRAAVGENYTGLVRTLIDAQLARGRVGDAVAAFEARRGWTFEASPGDPIATLERARRGGGNWVLLSWQPPTRQGALRVLLASPASTPVLLTLSASLNDLLEPLERVLRWQYDGTLRDQTAERWDALLTALAAVCLESPVLEARGLDGETRPALHDKTLRQLVGEHPEAELRIVPVGVLQLVPWAALPWGGRRLVEAHPVVLGTTLERVLREPPPVLDGDALVVGNPDDTLHYAGEEARLITGWLTQHRRAVAHHGPAQPLTAQQYRERAPRYGLHHLSTHAAMSWVSLMDSVVVMSGAPNAAPGTDAARRSLVRLPELLELSLPGSTIVLSACQSSMGDPARMFDAVSLSAAYLAAGAGRVLGSLWTVDDVSTALLMLRVYQGVLDDKLSWPRALQRAQVEMLRNELSLERPPEGLPLVSREATDRGRNARGGEREAVFTLPYHWAAFALYGR